jgi:signal transduction histidine kinase
LRRAAEERFGKLPKAEPGDQAESMRLLHELQVHQIELEMQNDELLQARDSISVLVDSYADLYDFAPVGYLTLGPDGHILQANLTIAKMLGTERSRLLNSTVVNFLADASVKPFLDFMAERFGGKGTPTSPDLACLLNPGRAGWIRLEASGAGTSLECRVAVVDVTERKRAEDDRRRFEADMYHTQKLESLGSLSAGIAHDINNVLAAIYAVVETQSLKAPQGSDLRSALDLILKATKRGRNLVGGLTAFARKGLLAPEPIDLNELVRQEVELLQRSTLQMVEFSLDLVEPPPFVHAERNRLAAALMNLCVNAIDAMPSGGRLSLRTGRSPGPSVTLTVEDWGFGMSQEVLQRAMDPFFTTKAFGMGTGLGLATTYSMAKSHGGTLLIDSTPGDGTRVTIQLPELSAAEIAKPIEELPSAHSCDTLSILLVDDDELIRASVPGMVETLGHRVESVASGREALGWIAGHPAVDLVILDQNMPGMHGLETLSLLRLTWPMLPVLMATGSPDSIPSSILENDPRVRVICKPFSLGEIENALGGFDRRGRSRRPMA